MIAGQFPGDGKPKEVAFPEPDTASVSIDGTNYLSLPNLVELKLASGMTNSERLKDLGDVQELIKLLNLPRNFAEQLRPYVRGKYDELWKSTTGQLKRYYLLWRNKFLTADAQSHPDMAETLRRAADQLQAMINDGIVLDPDQETGNDYAYLMTTDPQIARKYGMHEASEFFDLTNDDE